MDSEFSHSMIMGTHARDMIRMPIVVVQNSIQCVMGKTPSLLTSLQYNSYPLVILEAIAL